MASLNRVNPSSALQDGAKAPDLQTPFVLCKLFFSIFAYLIYILFFDILKGRLIPKCLFGVREHSHMTSDF